MSAIRGSESDGNRRDNAQRGDFTTQELGEDSDVSKSPSQPGIASDRLPGQDTTLGDGDCIAGSLSPTTDCLQDGMSQPRDTPTASQSVNGLPSTTTPCKCLSTTVSLLEELGSQRAHTSLDGILAMHKDYVGRCGNVLNCALCMSKPEPVMRLVLVYEKLVSFCEDMTNEHLRGKSQTQGKDQPITPRLDQQVVIGKYKTDSEEEWQCLVGALVLYQVKSLGRQMLLLRMPASVLLRGVQISKCLACERKLQALIESLRAS